MAKEKISVTQHGNDFLLSRVDSAGEKTSIVLSEQNLVAASRSIQQRIHRILAGRSQSRSGKRKSLSIPVQAVRLYETLDQSELLIDLVDSLDISTSYALPLEVAQDFAHRLPSRVATLEAAAKK
jgi:hypothetical protein